MARIACFIDGFNLYHAVRDLEENHLKWADLWRLVQRYVPERDELVKVYFFSAFAHHVGGGTVARHRAWITALEATGVETVMGHFKARDRHCRKCGQTFRVHEEKQTDVNLAVWLLDRAYQDEYDTALLLSGDSDLAPAVSMVAGLGKRVKIVVPPKRHLTKALAWAAGMPRDGADGAAEREWVVRIKARHMRRSLLPQQIRDAAGNVVAIRPVEYDPPTQGR